MRECGAIILIIFVSVVFVFGQSVGLDGTFDIVTWNLKEFPLTENTVEIVVEIINEIDVDMVVFQEILSSASFIQLLTLLDEWDGYRASSAGYDFNLAYIYKTDEIIENNRYEIYQDDWYAFPRAPLVIDISWNESDLLIVNNHLKCCGEDEDEDRRLQASETLKIWIEDYHSTENVILLGDLNDDIAEPSSDNVFWNFISDYENYKFTDMAIAEGSFTDWSYPSWPSHLDHIMITNELFDEFENEGTSVQTIHVEDYVANYFSEISDHLPVVLCLELFLPISIGDINFDGSINILDVVFLVHFVLGINNPTAEEITAGDFDSDGILSLLDIVQLVNLVLEY